VAPDHEYPSKLELRLTATDSGGLSSTAVVDLDPATVGLTFQSTPAGLTLTLNGASVVTPFSATVIVGSTNSVSASSPQTFGGTSYSFSNWSDGGAATHNLVAPASAATYTATYTAAPPPPPSTGLVAAYGFEEGAGTSVGDSSGTGNAGSVSGAAWTTAGKFGKALAFNGLNNFVSVADSNSLDLSTGMTLEAWVRPAALTGWTTVMLKERGTAGLAYSLYASDNTNKPPAGYINRGSDVGAAGTSALPLNAWSHLAVTYDGAALRLYVNAALATTRAITGAIPATANPLKIGGNAVWGEYFNGLIDEVRVYNRALAQSEVQTDMNAAVAGGAAAAASLSAAPAVAALRAAGAGGLTSASISSASDGVLEVDQGSRHRHRRHRHRLSLADAGAVRPHAHKAHHRPAGRAS
jgi:hypothetical protein